MAVPTIRAMAASEGDEVLVLVKSDLEAQLVALATHGDTKIVMCALRVSGEGRFHKLWRILRLVRAFRPDVSLVTGDVHPGLAGVLSIASNAPVRIGPETGPFQFLYTRTVVTSPYIHKVHFNAKVSEAAGRTAPHDISIAVPKGEAAAASRKFDLGIAGPRIAVALGSGVAEAHKRLPETRAAALVSKLVAAVPGARILLLGTQLEGTLNARIAALFPEQTVDLSSRTSLRELVAVLSLSDVLVTTCNGISHLGAAVGLPIVGLYGPTSPLRTGAFSTGLRVVSRRLQCSPCYRRGYTQGCGNPICMELDVDAIFTTICEVTQGGTSRVGSLKQSGSTGR